MKKWKHTRAQVRFRPSAVGIQGRFFVFLGLFVFVTFLIASYGLFGASQISGASAIIAEREVPLTKAINGALVAMLDGKFALEAALSQDDYARLGEIQKRETDLGSSIITFDAFVAAITWGSESEAFVKSDGGLNFAEWERRDLTDELIIRRPRASQVQTAGVTDLYFGGFANNAFRAIAAHKKFLRLGVEERLEEAEEARQTARRHANEALKFSGLAITSLSELVQTSNAAISESARSIGQTQREVGRNILYIFLIGSLVLLATSYFFVSESIVKPLRAITRTAEKIGSGDLKARATIKNKDEIGVLAAVFNEMADILAAQPSRLEAEVAERTQALVEANTRLQEFLHENYLSAKLLVQKDRELTRTNLELADRNREFDEIAKSLVRRDLELTRTNERLQEMDEMKSEFVSVAAHQLRTPLTGIKWTLYSLLETSVGKLNAEQRKIATDGYAAAIRLVELVNDLLDVARLEEGRYGFSFKKQPFLPVVKRVFKKFKEIADEKGVKLSLDVRKAKLPMVNMDEEKIGIALDNLIDNGVKYTSPGGTVSVVVAKAGNSIRVEVRDSGIGIPENQIDRVFGKFFRGENAQLFQTSGTGLGLYVTKNIITQHKGTISFESKEGKGSAFSFSLPSSRSAE